MNKIIKKIKEFWKKLNKKTLLIENKDNAIKKDELSQFKQDIKIKNNQEIIELKDKYEKGEITEKQLLPFQVSDLIDYYKK